MQILIVMVRILRQHNPCKTRSHVKIDDDTDSGDTKFIQGVFFTVPPDFILVLEMGWNIWKTALYINFSFSGVYSDALPLLLSSSPRLHDRHSRWRFSC